MSDVTRILVQMESGDHSCSESLFPLVYSELRRIAQAKMRNEPADHTLQATALVHEAYLRLVQADRIQRWESRGHFFAAAAEAMRRVLIESARRKRAAKRLGDKERQDLSCSLVAAVENHLDELLDVNQLLEELETEDPETAQLVKLRVFAGFSVEECGQLLGWSRATAFDTWKFAQAWFLRNSKSSAE